MTCNSCYPSNTELVGRNIVGRSDPSGYDVRYKVNGVIPGIGPIDWNKMPQREYIERQAGIPRTEAERMAQHYARYGNTSLPPRGTGLVRQQLGTNNLLAGIVIGFILGALVLTGTGRGIMGAAGKRVERRIRR